MSFQPLSGYLQAKSDEGCNDAVESDDIMDFLRVEFIAWNVQYF